MNIVENIPCHVTFFRRLKSMNGVYKANYYLAQRSKTWGSTGAAHLGNGRQVEEMMLIEKTWNKRNEKEKRRGREGKKKKCHHKEDNILSNKSNYEETDTL